VASSNFVRAAFVTAMVVGVDQGTKFLASGSLPTPHNPDYAFGVIGGSAPALIVGACVVLATFAVVIGRLALHLGIPVALPALVMGGTVGNTLDRVLFGSVRDFIVTPWCIVNVADVAVAAGLTSLAVAFLIRSGRARVANPRIRPTARSAATG
jgi:lipoprotein signal peptidase